MGQPEIDRETIKVQTVLYELDSDAITKFFSCIQACNATNAFRIVLHIGDASRKPLLSSEAIKFWFTELAKFGIECKYTFFKANLGPSKGHNTLWKEAPVGTKLLIINPDTVFPPHLITRLSAFADKQSDFGIVEARQIPLEHPKDFDLKTFQTSWSVTCCCLFNVEAFKAVEGFDETFFMYCDDVDISWRIRAQGYEVYYCIDTFIYHSKRLTATGMEVPRAEEYYGLINSLLLRTKYDREKLNEPVLKWLRTCTDPMHKSALREYRRLKGTVKPATKEEKKASLFTPDGNFARHRWYYHSIDEEANA